MLNNISKKAVGAGAAVVATVSSGVHAAAIDTSAAVTQIGETETAILAVGAAVIALAALAMGIRWVKATFF